jgi:hypothetical protein
VDFGLKALNSASMLTVEGDAHLHNVLAKFSRDNILSPLVTVYHQVDLLPWDLSEIISDLAQQVKPINQ